MSKKEIVFHHLSCATGSSESMKPCKTALPSRKCELGTVAFLPINEVVRFKNQNHATYMGSTRPFSRPCI